MFHLIWRHDLVRYLSPSFPYLLVVPYSQNCPRFSSQNSLCWHHLYVDIYGHVLHRSKIPSSLPPCNQALNTNNAKPFNISCYMELLLFILLSNIDLVSIVISTGFVFQFRGHWGGWDSDQWSWTSSHLQSARWMDDGYLPGKRRWLLRLWGKFSKYFIIRAD